MTSVSERLYKVTPRSPNSPCCGPPRAGWLHTSIATAYDAGVHAATGDTNHQRQPDALHDGVIADSVNTVSALLETVIGERKQGEITTRRMT